MGKPRKNPKLPPKGPQKWIGLGRNPLRLIQVSSITWIEFTERNGGTVHLIGGDEVRVEHAEMGDLAQQLQNAGVAGLFTTGIRTIKPEEGGEGEPPHVPRM